MKIIKNNHLFILIFNLYILCLAHIHAHERAGERVVLQVRGTSPVISISTGGAPLPQSHVELAFEFHRIEREGHSTLADIHIPVVRFRRTLRTLGCNKTLECLLLAIDLLSYHIVGACIHFYVQLGQTIFII